MKVIDLFSGLGGFSQAFVDRRHEVKRYDFDEKFKEVPHTTIKNVLDMTPIDLEHAEILLASPPCNCFSFAANIPGVGSKYWPKGIPINETIEQIKLVKQTMKIIKDANPKYWILENPQGYLRRVLGAPAKVVYWGNYGTKYLKPTHLWGNLPPIDWKMKPTKWESWADVAPRDPAKRALIPYDFSMAVCLAVEGNSPQTIISDFS